MRFPPTKLVHLYFSSLVLVRQTSHSSSNICKFVRPPIATSPCDFYLRFSDAAVYPQVDAAVAMQDSDYGASTPLQYLLLKSHC